MKYKPGDKVKIKSLDWYNANKNREDAVIFHNLRIFDKDMSRFCGRVVTIAAYVPRGDYYDIVEDGKVNYWCGEMFEGFAIEDELQEKMVSLNKVCDILYDMLHDQWINDGAMVGTWAYENMEEFVEDFCKRLEE